ncbi:AEC family transporter [Rhizosaccharibacter radicis]|uniref:AEC family transporter n=1 Tax=Rhizosaccharibacter radicis TaxID=2782605 RepID=A0ABT1VWJ4_9PROT|nr:AEC family transporter [Acetobacteraceae bacterium KSS12]
MHILLTLLLPIFGLILAGWLAGRFDLLGANGVDVLNRFVVRLALPALLLQSTAEVTRAQIDHPAFIAAFSMGMLGTFAIGLVLDWRRPADRAHRLGGATIEGLTAGYANTAFIGIPLCLGTFGPDGLTPVIIATLLTVCLLFALSILLVELELTGGLRQGAGRAVLAMIRHPLVLSPLAGGLLNIGGIGLPDAVRSFTGLLGSAASPCALVTIGLFLHGSTSAGGVSALAVGRVVALKLLVQPAVTAALVFWLLPMPPLWARSAVLIASLPTGTGPFMLARLYDREAGVAGRAILVSTVLSFFTVAGLLLVLGRRP